MIENIRKDMSFHIMLFPAVIVLFIYNYVPMTGAVIAFLEYKPIFGFFDSEFVGLDNFKFLFATSGFMRAFTNTVSIALMKIITGMIVPLTFSLLLNEVGNYTYKRVVQTVIYLPHFVSWVLMAGIIIEIFSPSGGLINNILVWAFKIKPIFFLGSNTLFQPVLVVTNIWKEFGWSTIIYLAALAGVNPTVYEAAIVDGAGRWKQTVHVTLPGIMPTVVLLTTLNLGKILNAGFDQVYNLMSPITMESGDIIDTFVFRMGLKNGQYSIATAAGLFKSIISSILIISSYKLAYRFSGYRLF